MGDDFGFPPRRKERWLPPWLKVVLLLFAVPLLLGFIAWLILDAVTRGELDEALASWTAKGRPVEPAELYPDPIPDDENAALLYEQAFVVLNFTSEELKTINNVMSLRDLAGLEHPERDALEGALNRNAEYFRLLHRAAELEQCQFDLDYSMGPAMLLPHLAPLRNATRALRTAALVAAADGQMDKALGFWVDSLGPPRHLNEERILICQLVRIACFSISQEALESLVATGQLSDEQLQRIVSELERMEFRRDFARSLEGELTSFMRLGRASGAELARSLGGGPSFLKVWGSAVLRPWRQYDVATGLALMDEGVDLAGQPQYLVQQQLDSWQAELDALTMWTPFSAMLLPSLSRAGDVVTNAEARQATAHVALASQRYRLAHGDYPEKLEDLVATFLPELPVDPFTGKPLLYVNDGSRVLVYSVGENLTDDGGDGEYNPRLHSVRDITFTLKQTTPSQDEVTADEE